MNNRSEGNGVFYLAGAAGAVAYGLALAITLTGVMGGRRATESLARDRTPVIDSRGFDSDSNGLGVRDGTRSKTVEDIQTSGLDESCLGGALRGYMPKSSVNALGLSKTYETTDY